VKGYAEGPSAQPFSGWISPAASRSARPNAIAMVVVVFGDESDDCFAKLFIYSLTFTD
jgi:hypothetical protein